MKKRKGEKTDEKTIKKAITWFMVVCMLIGFVPAFGSVAAADADLPSLPADEPQAVSTGGLFGMLAELFKTIGINLRSISVNEVLKLPANVMDDVVTYIFAVFRLLGLNIDSLYEKVTSIFFLQ